MKNNKDVCILWFRQDLRLSDNPALHFACEQNYNILPIYILDETNADEWKMGAASRWWLHESLKSLDNSLGHTLCFAQGDPATVLKEIIKQHHVKCVVWNRCYEPWQIKRDSSIKNELLQLTIDVKSFNGSLLFEPYTTVKNDGTPYKVFTPFYKKGCLARLSPREIVTTCKSLHTISHKIASLEDLQLLPSTSWYLRIKSQWNPGEAGAWNRLDSFFKKGIAHYKHGRDFPASELTSRLSPHLHFGEISPHQIWYQIETVKDQGSADENSEHFRSELGWREFSNNLLYHFPDLPEKNLQKKFDDFPWREDSEALVSWQQGMTGYPIIDAGMRELWQTGYMHNRVRMIVGSFLVKNLMIDWRHGQRWFWDTLLDADLANNSASWQWIAGCGADAAPYFRIFNPVTQGQKFDSDGKYIRRYIPELQHVPNKFIHNPWQASHETLKMAQVTLGDTYPWPIVELKSSRERALEAFKQLTQPS